ncbi:MAG: lysophospholipid acyltransferase family protein [Candidatus Cyclobacteriaceae bacterium M2_1C_046]
MNLLKKLYYRIYTGWVVLVFTVFLIILFPFFITPLLIHQKLGWITCRFLALWAGIFSKLTFIEYKIYGSENIKKGEAYIFTSNHTSYLDSPGIALAVPYQWRPLGKKELVKIPVFGLMLKYLAIIVDRSNPKSRQESMKNMTNMLNLGISILIFPEGTMNRSNNVLQPFYDGAFRIAIETQKPIIPITILNAGKLLPPNEFLCRPGKIEVYVGKPISSEGLTLKETPILKNQTYEKMSQLIEKGNKQQ